MLADVWDTYCKEKEEKRKLAEKERNASELAQKQLEIEKKIFEEKEAKTLIIKNRLLEAEKALLSPMPPYPVPPPIKPTIEKIFSKVTNEHLKPVETLVKKDLEDLENSEVAIIPTEFNTKKSGDLVEPPDLAKSKPLDIERYFKKKKSSAEQIVKKKETLPEFVYEFESLPVDMKLNRQEASTIVEKSISIYAESMKKWIQGMMEYEQDQWNQRLSNLQKCREARDLDRMKDEVKTADKQNSGPKNPAGDKKKKK